MANWTPESSTILSLLLDEVVGTKDVIKIRQDFCRIYDNLLSFLSAELCGDAGYYHHYYTGSKAEGLDLPGSDEDYMYEVNDLLGIAVIQSVNDIQQTYHYNHVYFMDTENAPPGFVLLRCLRRKHDNVLRESTQQINGLLHLSSKRFLDVLEMGIGMFQKLQFLYFDSYQIGRQGPSVEQWSQYQDPSDSGKDTVSCIRCKFWPNSAKEWVERPRYFGWPTASDISSIVDFGCHLVPVGHPHSNLNPMEWRISFSIAERILVSSFNHIQMQLYAVMKIILKEFIKTKCTPRNQILCSYFIKTFLFWMFEKMDSNFWCAENFRDCFRFLISEFSQYINDGVLRHYFCPQFNLLSVKLTREAKIELSQLLDVVIQSDIHVFSVCQSLCNIWSIFVASCGMRDAIQCKVKRHYILSFEDCMMLMMKRIAGALVIFDDLHLSLGMVTNITKYISRFIDLPCQTPLLPLTLKYLQFYKYFNRYNFRCSKNKDVYQLHRAVKINDISFDISTCKLRYAMLLLMKGDYISALLMVNHVLLKIPPYALYHSGPLIWSSKEANDLFVGMIEERENQATKRTKMAWLNDLLFVKHTADNLPLGIQIELYFCDSHVGVWLSPYVCAYYIMFLCYHGLGDYEGRKRALRKLVEVVNDIVQCGIYVSHAYNIAGHCMLMVGDVSGAYALFNASYRITEHHPLGRYNSAVWYLQNINL